MTLGRLQSVLGRLRLFRHVEAVPEGHSREVLRGASYSRPLPHRGEDEQGTGRSSCLRIAPHRLRRPHSCAEKSRWLLLKREENLKPEQRFRLRDHRELILNYFRAQKLLSSGVVEGLNNKVKATQLALAAIF